MMTMTRFQNLPRLPIRRTVALMILVLIVTLITIFASWVLTYRPALSPASSHEMLFVTKPTFWENPIRVWEMITEQRPCEYQILGWDVDNRLYYQANCGSETQIWEYGSAQGHKVAATLPNELIQHSVSKDNVLDLVYADRVIPREYEQVTRPLLLESKGYFSHDEQLIAIVTQHIYGPQDIIILTSKN